MNFLGHLYFSQDNYDLMVSNLYGDFFRGSDFSGLPPIVEKGILLHRSIDDFIDNHYAIRDLLHLLYSHLPKVAGIAVDLYVDHLLAKKWHQFHTVDYQVFVNDFLDFIQVKENLQFSDKYQFQYSDEFIFLLEKLVEMKWINDYNTLNGIQRAADGLKRRLSFDNVLDQVVDVFLKFQKEIEHAFDLFIIDANHKFNG